MDLTNLQKQLDDFESFVESYSKQMDDIVKGKLDTHASTTLEGTKIGFDKTVIQKPAAAAAAPPSANVETVSLSVGVSEGASPAAEKNGEGGIKKAVEKKIKKRNEDAGESKKPKTAKERVDLDYSRFANLPSSDDDDDNEEDKEEEEEDKEEEKQRPKPTTTTFKTQQPPPLPAHILPTLTTHKQKGNQAFQSQNYPLAEHHYTTAIQTCLQPPPFPTTDPFQFLNSLPATPFEPPKEIYTNRALCRLRLGNLEGCIQDCTRVLERDPRDLKALWRRAEARRGLGDYEGARVDVEGWCAVVGGGGGKDLEGRRVLRLLEGERGDLEKEGDGRVEGLRGLEGLERERRARGVLRGMHTLVDCCFDVATNNSNNVKNVLVELLSVCVELVEVEVWTDILFRPLPLAPQKVLETFQGRQNVWNPLAAYLVEQIQQAAQKTSATTTPNNVQAASLKLVTAILTQPKSSSTTTCWNLDLNLHLLSPLTHLLSSNPPTPLYPTALQCLHHLLKSPQTQPSTFPTAPTLLPPLFTHLPHSSEPQNTLTVIHNLLTRLPPTFFFTQQLQIPNAFETLSRFLKHPTKEEPQISQTSFQICAKLFSKAPQVFLKALEKDAATQRWERLYVFERLEMLYSILRKEKKSPVVDEDEEVGVRLGVLAAQVWSVWIAHVDKWEREGTGLERVVGILECCLRLKGRVGEEWWGRLVGNLGWGLGEWCRRDGEGARDLHALKTIDTLLHLLRLRGLPTGAQKNLAIACARCCAYPPARERLKELGGLEVLYGLGDKVL
ncbi:Sperm associated antigen 1 [Chytridiales sp. JEL 0842]|nr:Sperm associated antigen 1 [Chytridiales sp. JEL 0842]